MSETGGQVDQVTGRRARTRRALIRGAMELIAEKGSSSLTMSAVAQRAGTSHGTVYNYFDGVEQLLDGVAAELATVFEFGSANLAKLDTDPRARVAFGIHRVLSLPTEDPTYATAFSVLIGSLPTFRRNVRDVVGTHVQRGIDAGVFDVPSHDVATDALLGAVLQVLRSELADEVEDAIVATVTVCLRLLAVDDDAIPSVIALVTATRG